MTLAMQKNINQDLFSVLHSLVVATYYFDVGFPILPEFVEQVKE